MKTTKKVIMVSVVFLITILAASCASTKAIHETNKENMAAIKADTRANYEAASRSRIPDSVKQVEGFEEIFKAIWDSIVEGAEEEAENTKKRQENIQSGESYRNTLEAQRESRQNTINP